MDLFDPTQNLLGAAMRGAAARQTALAQNLANANTPGYQRVDVDFHSMLEQASGTGDAETVGFTAEVDGAARMRLDGSTVDVDREAAELAANGLEYQALVSVAQGRIGIIQSALGVR
ncbi:flagellar basal body rod protein FlgB [Capillimicrobium parvum]|uniref:Flagellar basal body rod protein FlgB n=1 Tax=Capillimicrobium parvum TaxID=2884022 RepID=A0A9E7BW75_9ACTN|nr:flagellar basal body protein [Capillimicrobium parvum]UGS33705.1 Flagellar basal body rod protein FlgB [Capillimicrobium parvum]